MQELEKILEEIKVSSVYAKTRDGYGALCVPIGTIERIIRKHMNGGWIPVERELPPNAKRKGDFCPKYYVMTKYGVTEGGYNPDCESWYVLIWFMTDRYLDSEIDFDRGDKPQIVRLPNKVNNANHILTAWQPLPEPYRPERRKDGQAD